MASTPRRLGRPFYTMLAVLVAFTLGVAGVCLALCLVTIDSVSARAQERIRTTFEMTMDQIALARSATDLAQLGEDLANEGLDVSDAALLAARLAEMEGEVSSRDSTRLYAYLVPSGELVGAGSPDARPSTPSWLAAIAEQLPLDSKGFSATRFVTGPDGIPNSVRIESFGDHAYLLLVTYGQPPMTGFEALLMDDDGTEMFYYDTYGAAVPVAGSGTSLMGEFTYDTLGEAEGGSVSFSHNGHAYTAYYDKVADSDTKFALFSPDHVTEVKQTLLVLVIAITVVTIAALVGISVVAARKLYAPVQGLMARIPLEEDARTRARDDFHLLGEALDRQQTSLEDQGTYLRKEWLYHQLHGQKPLIPDSENALGAKGLLHDEDRFAAVLLSVDAHADGTDIDSAPEFDPRELARSVEELALGTGHSCDAVWDDSALVLVFKLQTSGSLDLGAFLQWLKDRIESAEGLLVSLYASAIHRGAQELSAAYGETVQVRDHCALLEKYNVVLGYDDLLAQAERGDRVHLDAAAFCEMRSFVDQAYRDPNLSAKAVADRFGTSQSGITRAFKKFTGGGFLEYLHGLRLAEASALLRSSDLPLAEIAARAGYTNPLTLTRAFKRYMGMTPGEYRKTGTTEA